MRPACCRGHHDHRHLDGHRSHHRVHRRHRHRDDPHRRHRHPGGRHRDGHPVRRHRHRHRAGSWCCARASCRGSDEDHRPTTVADRPAVRPRHAELRHGNRRPGACPGSARTGCCPAEVHPDGERPTGACPGSGQRGCSRGAGRRDGVRRDEDRPAEGRHRDRRPGRQAPGPTARAQRRAPRAVPPAGRPGRQAPRVPPVRRVRSRRRVPPPVPVRRVCAPGPAGCRPPVPAAPGRRHAACGRPAVRWSTKPTSRTRRARRAWP